MLIFTKIKNYICLHWKEKKFIKTPNQNKANQPIFYYEAFFILHHFIFLFVLYSINLHFSFFFYQLSFSQPAFSFFSFSSLDRFTVQHLCGLQDAMPHQWSTGTSHPLSYWKHRIFLGVASILSMCLAHILGLFAINLQKYICNHYICTSNYKILYLW